MLNNKAIKLIGIIVSAIGIAADIIGQSVEMRRIDEMVKKSVDEALKLDADVATGATYSSEALIKNIKMGLQQAKGSSSKKADKAKAKSKGKAKGKKRMSR